MENFTIQEASNVNGKLFEWISQINTDKSTKQ